MRFTDRHESGMKLAEALSSKVKGECVIYALPRGGVVVAKEIADILKCPLDLVITRKIGHPGNPEYAIAVIAEDGHTLANESEVSLTDKDWYKTELKRQQEEAKRRRKVYLGGRKPVSPKGKTAIIVDDGIATGLSLTLAVNEIKHLHPSRTIVAVPVAPADSAGEISKKVDEFVALDIPEFYLGAVGAYYDEFRQVEDDEVIELLSKTRGRGR